MSNVKYIFIVIISKLITLTDDLSKINYILNEIF